MIHRGPLLGLAIALAWLSPAITVAQTVGVFGARRVTDSPAELDVVVRSVVTELASRNSYVTPGGAAVTRPLRASAEELEQIRALGSAAFGELAEGRSNDELLATYDARFENALTRVSSVRDPDSRAVLWNLCLLRVQLLARKGDDGVTRSAVENCRRRFVDVREISETWPEGVVRAFAQHDETAKHAELEIKSSPTGCRVLLFGGEVGDTPLRLPVLPGLQEIELACSGQSSRLHRIQVDGDTDLTIWLAGDQALTDRSGLEKWLEYKSAPAFGEVVEHVLAFARESRMPAFALVTPEGSGHRIALYKDGFEERSVRVSASATVEQRLATVRQLLDGGQANTGDGDQQTPSILADTLVAGALTVAGGALLIYPIRSLKREGNCVDSTCEREYEGKTPVTMGLFAAGTALVTSGLLVLAWRPLSHRKRPVSIQAGFGHIQFRGHF